MITATKKRVAYLFGAGASHASVKAVGGVHGILMKDLTLELAELVRNSVYRAEFAGSESLRQLANNVIGEESDVEHIITFLAQSPSALHRKFADELRTSFETVLKKRIAAVYADVGEAHCNLYVALIDMYDVEGFPEVLNGCLTLNYDAFLETAVSRFRDRHVDYGIALDGPGGREKAVAVLKLHGSFDWEDVWPIRRAPGAIPLWIPPGIQKAKDGYPFNLLWGRARELLDCDILRIVGCSLSPNDWDLVSLLFSTRHIRDSGNPYQVEIIDSPRRASRLKEAFPYLNVKSILEAEPVGSQLVAELTGGEPRRFATLETAEQEQLTHQTSDKNWFLVWLSLMAETTYRDLGSVSTPAGAFKSILEAYA
jgi:hypothetical protein